MEDIYQEIIKIRSQGERAALATIISTKGATPRKEGAKLLVKSDGTTMGTICGGCVEAEVYQEALKVMEEGKTKILHFRLTEKEAVESGMICGGDMEVFVEPILSEPTIYIFGAGHISFFLAKIAKIIGFKIVVVDDRELFANRERFPEADEVIAEDFHTVFRRLSINKLSYLVIVTRGHLHDELVLEQAIKTEANYIGMIGSKKKIKTVFSHLEEKGIARKTLDRVYAPIGLDVNSETPEEIAISILAEIIKVKGEGKTDKLKKCEA